jgi:hypothetical protein
MITRFPKRFGRRYHYRLLEIECELGGAAVYRNPFTSQAEARR